MIKRREKDSEDDGLPPGHARIASSCDLDARWGVERDTFWLGYRLHVTETCDDQPLCGCPAAGNSATGWCGHEKDCAAPRDASATAACPCGEAECETCQAAG